MLGARGCRAALLAWSVWLGGQAAAQLVPGDVASLLESPDTPCDAWRQGLLVGLEAGLDRLQGTREAFAAHAQEIAERLEGLREGEEAGYHAVFRDAAGALRTALDLVELLGVAALRQGRRCLRSAARSALGAALPPLHVAMRHHVGNLWWMFDISSLSNTMSPPKHFAAVHSVLEQVEHLAVQLYRRLPPALEDEQVAWGHEDHGMFMNSTVIFRSMFPEQAIVDRGVLRFLLRLLPADTSIADFGALDGQYGRWLNDTGLVTAFAFDGVHGIEDLTQGSVSHADLASPLHLWRSFDWVMSLEVAEHISPHLESTYLSNLARHATEGLVVSWAPPHVLGEGHVNCKEPDESRKAVEGAGFRQDEAATRRIRAAAEVPWIKESIAVYRRVH